MEIRILREGDEPVLEKVAPDVLTDRANEAAMRLYEAGGGEPSGDHVMFTFHLDRQ